MATLEEGTERRHDLPWLGSGEWDRGWLAEGCGNGWTQAIVFVGCLFIRCFVVFLFLFLPSSGSQGEAKNLDAFLIHPSPGLGLFVGSWKLSLCMKVTGSSGECGGGG